MTGLGSDRRVHFVGIGGAGMSAIAKVLIERGVRVSGSDLKRSRAATLLEAIGARVNIGHDDSLIDKETVVVVSSAIPESNPELRKARSLGVEILTRGEALAAVLDGLRSIVVAGTHGKTTTTSMITTVLRVSGWDPTYLIGGGLNESGTNARRGSGEFAVAESDESDGSFLLLSPSIAVITNLELDHVDYWESATALRAGFSQFIDRTGDDATVVVPADDADLGAYARATRRVVTFGVSDGDFRAESLEATADGTNFVLTGPSGRAPVSLKAPGRHNVANALAAAAACEAAGLTLAEIANGLDRYRGVERRFQIRGRARGVTVIDDYAHHPTEVRATLDAAGDGRWRRVVAVFQPHRYSRTAAFSEELGESLTAADHIVVTDVYGAGEPPVPGVTGKLVVDAVCKHAPGRPVAYMPHRRELVGYLVTGLRDGDAVLTLGAGDVTSVGDELLARLREIW